MKPDDLIASAVRKVREDTIPKLQVTPQHQVTELVEGARRGSREMVSAPPIASWTSPKASSISCQASSTWPFPPGQDRSPPISRQRRQARDRVRLDRRPPPGHSGKPPCFRAWTRSTCLHRWASTSQPEVPPRSARSAARRLAIGGRASRRERRSRRPPWPARCGPHWRPRSNRPSSAGTAVACHPPWAIPADHPLSPVVALLALLALVAPATLRRLGEVPDLPRPHSVRLRARAPWLVLADPMPGLRREPSFSPAKSKLKHGRNHQCDIPRL